MAQTAEQKAAALAAKAEQEAAAANPPAPAPTPAPPEDPADLAADDPVEDPVAPEDVESYRDAVARHLGIHPAAIKSLHRDPEDGRLVVVRHPVHPGSDGPDGDTKRSILPWPPA